MPGFVSGSTRDDRLLHEPTTARRPCKFLDESHQCHLVGFAQLPEFHDIHAPLSGLAFGNEGLRTPRAFRRHESARRSVG